MQDLLILQETSYKDAHESSSQITHDAIRDYLKNNVTDKYRNVNYTITHKSAVINSTISF
jgi:hypothetical protein